MGLGKDCFFNPNWSANVEEMKSPREPESIRARHGCPLILTVTIIGFGTRQEVDFEDTAFR